MANTPEFRAVATSTGVLVEGIAADIERYAEKFHDEELITDAEYNIALKSTHGVDDSHKARRIVQNITAKVKARPSLFYELLRVLRELGLTEQADKVETRFLNYGDKLPKKITVEHGGDWTSLQQATPSSDWESAKGDDSKVKGSRDEMMDPVEILKKNSNHLIIAFTLHMKELAHLMNREEFLSDYNHEIVVNVRSMLSDRDKASIMVSSLINKVKLNPINLYKFRGLVNRGGRKFQVLADLLSHESSERVLGDDKYEKAYKHFIASKDVLDLLSLKFMFLGPPRQGKSTTRRRVTKEIVDLFSANEAHQVHGSTGTVECCPNVLVQDKSDSATTQYKAKWTIVRNDSDEACLLFHSLKNTIEAKSIPVVASNSLEGNKASAEIIQSSSTEKLHPAEKSLHKILDKMKNSLVGQPTPDKPAPENIISPDFAEIEAIYREVSQQPKFVEYVKHTFKAYLRMVDTGGQPEFMDMLPALTIGPALYLLFFSYEFKLDEQYQVFYQRDSGETTVPEKSEFTLEEMLLCTLSAISCSSAYTDAKFVQETENSKSEILESSKSVVYIVGTHKDKVSEEYITKVDKQLQTLIEDTEFDNKGIIQFCAEKKLVFSLDNMRGGVEEIHDLHLLLERAMDKHFKKLRIPAVWFLFSLCLRMRNVKTASMEFCLALSRAFNMTLDETKVALWFLHHHAGVLMYFPNVAGLEDLIIIDIQVVYDSITSIILKAMSFDCIGHAKNVKFKKTGRFLLEDIESAVAGISNLIPPHQLVVLLEYLHIIAQIQSDKSSANLVSEDDKEYIMPCVLEYTNSKELDLFHEESCKSCFVAPFFIHFTCGFTPLGLFPAAMACLISNKSFSFDNKSIKKNMVHFQYGPKQIRVTFISRSTYYEIVVKCDPTFKDSIHQECVALKQEIENTLKEASSRMNYSSYMEYKFAFECYKHEKEVGKVCESGSIPSVMRCVKDPQGVPLQNRHLIWYGQKYKEQAVHRFSESEGASRRKRLLKDRASAEDSKVKRHCRAASGVQTDGQESADEPHICAAYPIINSKDKSDGFNDTAFCGSVEYVLTVANTNEFQGVNSMISSVDCTENSKGLTHHKGRVYLGLIGKHPIGLIKTRKGTKCVLDLQEGLKEFCNAKYLISVGVCYGFNREEVNFGDVIISKEILRFGDGQVLPDDIVCRGGSPSIKENIFHLFGEKCNSVDNFQVAKSKRYAEYKIGKIVSLPWVNKDKKMKKKILRQSSLKDHFLGGEMESDSILDIQDQQSIAAIVIKAVTDFGDHKKTSDWQIIGTQAAFHYIKSKMKFISVSEVEKVWRNAVRTVPTERTVTDGPLSTTGKDGEGFNKAQTIQPSTSAMAGQSTAQTSDNPHDQAIQDILESLAIGMDKLKQRPDSNTLHNIAKMIPSDDWEMYALELIQNQQKINDIKADYSKVQDRRYQALLQWKQKRGLHATFKELVKVFVKENQDLATQVCELLKLLP